MKKTQPELDRITEGMWKRNKDGYVLESGDKRWSARIWRAQFSNSPSNRFYVWFGHCGAATHEGWTWGLANAKKAAERIFEVAR